MLSGCKGSAATHLHFSLQACGLLTKPTLAPCFLFELRSLKTYSGGMKQAIAIIHTFTDTDCNVNKIFNGEAQIAVCISQAGLECMCTVGDEGVLMPH